MTVDAQVPPMPKFGRHEEPNVKELAALCVGGDAKAGVSLVQRLEQGGVEPTIRTLVLLAVPTGQISPSAFDLLADALGMAGELRELMA